MIFEAKLWLEIDISREKLVTIIFRLEDRNKLSKLSPSYTLHHRWIGRTASGTFSIPRAFLSSHTSQNITVTTKIPFRHLAPP